MSGIPEVIQIGALQVAVSVSDRRRHVRLTVERDSSIAAVVPPETTTEQLVKLVKSRRPWLFDKLSERERLGSLGPRKRFVSGEGFLYLGRSYRLRIVEPGAPTRLVAGRLEFGRGGGADEVTAWYQRIGQRWLKRRAAPWAERMGLAAPKVKVRPLGYRWGSCSPDGSVNIHWASLQLPPSLIDYVLVHELAHLTVRDHNPDFWLLVERVLPDAQERRRRLKQVGAELWFPLPFRSAGDSDQAGSPRRQYKARTGSYVLVY